CAPPCDGDVTAAIDGRGHGLCHLKRHALTPSEDQDHGQENSRSALARRWPAVAAAAGMAREKSERTRPVRISPGRIGRWSARHPWLALPQPNPPRPANAVQQPPARRIAVPPRPRLPSWAALTPTAACSLCSAQARQLSSQRRACPPTPILPLKRKQ